MKKLIKKIWHDPVWSKVLGALILAAITGSFELFTKLKLWTWFISTLVYKVSIPVWGLILISIPAIIIFVLILKPSSSPNPVFIWEYRMDTIDGVKWEWVWNSDEVANLIALCPVCMCELENKAQLGMMNTSNTLYCQKCDKYIDTNIHISDLKRKVKKEIVRRVRTGEYKDIVLARNS